MDEVALLCIIFTEGLRRISPAYQDLVMKSVSPLLWLRLGLLDWFRTLIRPSFGPQYSIQLTLVAYRRSKSKKSDFLSAGRLRLEGRLSALYSDLLLT